jgi:hypothetical protein
MTPKMSSGPLVGWRLVGYDPSDERHRDVFICQAISGVDTVQIGRE